MAESTQLHDNSLSTAKAQATSPGSLARNIWRGIGHTLFWAYERGTWQYDLIVMAILAFIFFTPRSWFEDRPTLQLTDLRHVQGIVEVRQSNEGGTYIVDARLVESMATANPEDAIRDIVKARVHKPFVVKSVGPLRDRHNIVLGYTVTIAFQ